MKRIVYLGSAFAGKSENLRALQRSMGGRLTSHHPRDTAEGTILSFEARSAHGPVTLSTVPGFVFRDAARRAIIAAADAIVFVADGRPKRFYQTVESWEALPDYLEGRPTPPVVLQYNFRDAPDATPIETIEETLGVRGSKLFPHRIASVAVRGTGVRETFEAAAQAAYLGMLERDASMPRLEEEAVGIAEATVLHEFTCEACQHVQSHFEIAFQEPGAEGPFRVGGELPFDPARIDPELYLPIRPHRGGALLVLDAQRCPKCASICWLGLVLEGRKLTAVWPVTLTRTTLERCHYATAGLVFEAARLVGLTEDDLMPEETLPILRRHLAP